MEDVFAAVVNSKEDKYEYQNITPINGKGDFCVPVISELFAGELLALLPPPQDTPEFEEFTFREHFRGRRRLWELRLQGRFLKDCDPTKILLGIKTQTYSEMSYLTRLIMEGFCTLIRSVTGMPELARNFGATDEPGPLEFGPLWALDAIDVSLPGMEPNIMIPEALPGFESRDDAKEFLSRFGVDQEHVYTFGLWGPAQYIDLMAWSVGTSMTSSMSIASCLGYQPIHLILYYKPDEEDHQLDKAEYLLELAISHNCLGEVLTDDETLPIPKSELLGINEKMKGLAPLMYDSDSFHSLDDDLDDDLEDDPALTDFS